PAQSLTYSLGAGAPFGATIHPSTGVFAWTPNAAPATNSISVVVTDSGIPSLNATQTFSVIVYLPPAIGVQFSGSQIQLSWPRGTLQQANDVAGPYTDVTATSPATVSISTSQKFFRIHIQ
ncbi:MAG: putative Ig domain-containing protein, partial [Verrucomicrobiota bacterium]